MIRARSAIPARMGDFGPNLGMPITRGMGQGPFETPDRLLTRARPGDYHHCRALITSVPLVSLHHAPVAASARVTENSGDELVAGWVGSDQIVWRRSPAWGGHTEHRACPTR